MSRHWIWIPALVVVLAAPAGAEQSYRWKDESGRTHFSNVGPAGEEVSPEGERREALPAVESAPAPEGAVTRDRDGGAEGALSDEVFSTTASRKRGELQTRLRSLERELRGIDSEMQSIRQVRNQTYEERAAPLQGVSRPEYMPSTEEEKLAERRKEIEKEIAGIHAEYDKLREAAVKRTGSVPGWWRPLD